VVIRILDKEAITKEIADLKLELLGSPRRICAACDATSIAPTGWSWSRAPRDRARPRPSTPPSPRYTPGRKRSSPSKTHRIQLRGVVQIPVNEKKGLTFARGLRSILRHDPDRILVGEIRDPETAQIAVQSALTGHLVFTTVHANNVMDVLGRFLNMGWSRTTSCPR